MSEYIINSLLDTDLYKITMLRTYLHRFANCVGRYEFVDRNPNRVYTQTMFDRINLELDHLCELRFTKEEVEWVGNLRFMSGATGFLEFLRMFKLNREYIVATLTDGKLSVVADGPIFQSSYFETFVLSIVNETYFAEMFPNHDMTEGKKILSNTIKLVKDYVATTGKIFKFSDFGTRRRFSREWQEYVVRELYMNLGKNGYSNFTGTSNMDLARRLGLIAIGTMAHEYLCLGQALRNVSLQHSQQYMFEQWADEYNGDLGYALTDNLTSKKFFRDFGMGLGKLYDGLRNDSGNALDWTDDAIDFYNSIRVNPKSKSLVYSNGLHMPEALKLNDYRYDETTKSFGIGTSLTNNVGVDPLNIVMKLVYANGQPVVKISDDKDKLLANNVDMRYYEYVKSVIS